VALNALSLSQLAWVSPNLLVSNAGIENDTNNYTNTIPTIAAYCTSLPRATKKA